MTNNTPAARGTLTHCEACGEDYSPSYRRCPFCGERNPAFADEQKDGKETKSAGSGAAPKQGTPAPNKKKKKSAAQDLWERSGLSVVRIVGFLFTLAIIVAVFLLVTRVVLPMIDRGDVDLPNEEVTQPQEPDGNTDVSFTNGNKVPGSSNNPEGKEPTGEFDVNHIPADQTATSFTINLKEFTISSKYPDPVPIKVTLIPAGSVGTVHWFSSDESVAVVTEKGVVYAVGKGEATITGILPGGATQSCFVRSTIVGNPPPASTASGSSSSETSSGTSAGTLTLNRSDITMDDRWPTFTFQVTGATGTVTWVSSDPSVATVDQNGKVTKVSKGKCTVTATDSKGRTGECIIRVK